MLTLNEEQIVNSCAQDDKTPYKLVSRAHKSDDTVIDINGVKVGIKGQPVMIAGPCAVESREQLFAVAESVSKAGVKLLRGGAFKPRTSPYSFQGLGLEGLKLLFEAAEKFDLRVVTEVTDTANLDDVARYAHVLQIGSRNMHNYALLKAVGAKNMPVLLKRGMSATIEEFLCAAEYLLLNGSEDVILCERGIRSFDSMTRNTLDLSAVALIKTLSHLPVIVDPSHACGRVDIIPQMSKAAIVAGADGLIIEVSSDPDSALCDGAQSLTVDSFTRLTKELAVITNILPRVL